MSGSGTGLACTSYSYAGSDTGPGRWNSVTYSDTLLRTSQVNSVQTILQRIAGGDQYAVQECLKTYGGLVWSLGNRKLFGYVALNFGLSILAGVLVIFFG